MNKTFHILEYSKNFEIRTPRKGFQAVPARRNLLDKVDAQFSEHLVFIVANCGHSWMMPAGELGTVGCVSVVTMGTKKDSSAFMD